MADIVKVDLTAVADSQLATWQKGFELSTYDNNGAVTLKAGFVEFLGGYPYRVEAGDLTITPGTLSDGAVYLYITEDGDGTATASLSNTAPAYDVAKGGFYNGTSKAIFVMNLASSSYNDRYRMTEVGRDLGCQLGQIIDIHPLVIKKPNAFNFLLCGSTPISMGGNFTGSLNNPNLVGVYIKGTETLAATTGGSNTNSHTHSHSHTIGGHNHEWYNEGGGTGTGSINYAANSSNTFDISGNAKAVGISAGSYYTANKDLTSNPDSTAPSDTNNEPSYFTALKYIRIR